MTGGVDPSTWMGMRPDDIGEYRSRGIGGFSASGASGSTGKICQKTVDLVFPHRSPATGGNRGWHPMDSLLRTSGKARSRSRHVALLKFGIFHSEISGPCCLVAKFRFDDSEFEPARDCYRFSPFVDTPHVRGENPPFPRPDFPLMSLPFVGLAGNRTPAR